MSTLPSRNDFYPLAYTYPENAEYRIVTPSIQDIDQGFWRYLRDLAPREKAWLNNPAHVRVDRLTSVLNTLGPVRYVKNEWHLREANRQLIASIIVVPDYYNQFDPTNETLQRTDIPFIDDGTDEAFYTDDVANVTKAFSRAIQRRLKVTQ